MNSTSAKNTEVPLQEYITIREAVALLPISEKHLRDAIKAGRIKYILAENQSRRQGSWGRHVKHVSRAEVESWARSR